MPSYLLYFGSVPLGDSGVPYRGELRASGLPRVLSVTIGHALDVAFRVAPVRPLPGPDGEFADGALIFANGESLTATLWPGGADGPEVPVEVDWLEQPSERTNLARLRIPETATTDLPIGRYRLRVDLIDSESTKFAVAEVDIHLMPVAGTGPVSRGPAYALASDVDGVLGGDWSGGSDLSPAGHADEIDAASRWADSMVLERFETRRRDSRWQGFVVARPPSDAAVRSALAAGGLLVDAGLIRAVALRAASIVRGRGTEDESKKSLRDEADTAMKAWKGRIDLDDDGTHETEV